MELLLRERSRRIVSGLELDRLSEERPEVFVGAWEYVLGLPPGKRRESEFLGIIGNVLHALCGSEDVDRVSGQIREEWPNLTEREVDRVMTEAVQHWFLGILMELPLAYGLSDDLSDGVSTSSDRAVEKIISDLLDVMPVPEIPEQKETRKQETA